LIDVRGQAAGPTAVSGGLQAAVRLTLQQGFTLQVVSDQNRAEQYGHACALRRLGRGSAVQLVQRHRLVHAAARQAKQAGEPQNREAQSSHRSVQVAATRLATVKKYSVIMKNARPRRRLKGPIIREYARRLQRESNDLRHLIADRAL
jgi:hypothetical protein